jgi:hypothetical protein
MAVQLPISYETLLRLVEQLPEDAQQDLLRRLQVRTQQRKLTKEEWDTLFDSIKIDIPIGAGFSLNREDWYDDEDL